MGSLSVTRDNLPSMLRPTLFLASLATYFASPEDVVWRFIKLNPDARRIEHFAFGIAATLLGVALVLKVQASVSRDPPGTRTTIANVLQAIGIGSLLPLPGFLLFVLGDLGISLLPTKRRSTLSRQPLGAQTASWRGALVEHIGLCCAFVSMIVFSAALIDRLADALFATSALIALLAGARRTLQTRPHR